MKTRENTKMLLATTNEGKLRELKKIFEDVDVELVSLDDIPAVTGMDVVEDGETFKDNACKKAIEYGKKAQMLTLADDSGLVVDALEGRPGVHSKRYGKTDQERISKLLDELDQVEDGDRSARFVAVMAVYDPEDDRVYTSEGVVEGRITHEPQGDRGFGYDPVFYSVELKKTFSQATQEEKNAISHRGRAIKQILPMVKELLA